MSGTDGFVIAVPKHFLHDKKGPSVRIWLGEQILIDDKSGGAPVESMPFAGPVDAAMLPFRAAQIRMRFTKKPVDQPEKR